MHYSAYDYLWSEPYLVEGVGKIKCPTLLDIRIMTYDVFYTYLNMTLASNDDMIPKGILKEMDLGEGLSVYYFLLLTNPQFLLQYIKVFIANDDVRLNEENGVFEIIDRIDDIENIVGQINNDNFDVFRNNVATILGLKNVNEKPLKFKNERARKLLEKIQRNNKNVKKADANLVLDNMVLKFCVNNKTGINMLNIGNLTYFQFIQLFNEYAQARQADHSDAIAANTFSYKDSKDYNSMLWMEKSKKENY